MFGSDLDSAQLLQALYETLYMVSIALFLGDGSDLKILIKGFKT
jgi:ABC-type methionine transport system permease subunit